MENKQHEYILKAFLNSNIPSIIRKNAPELISLDSDIGGYCTRLIKREKIIKGLPDRLILRDEKNMFSELINHSYGVEKDELVFYYRLIILVESILIQYR